MRLAIFSDCHLGFGRGTERAEDSFEAFEEAVEKSLDCDAVIIPGDVFDTREPGSEAIGKAIAALSKAKLSESRARIERLVNKESPFNSLAALGMPVIMLAGNHEKRARGFVNPVGSLEKAGFATYLHGQSVVLGKDGERTAIHGLSAVPEQFFGEVMRQWSPQPMPGCFNMLILHQIFSEFAFSGRGLTIETIPKGFEFYVDGDIHEPQLGKLGGKPFLVCGSLIPTQLRKEAVKPKGIWKLETSTGRLDFLPLEKTRKVYYLEPESTTEKEIESEIERIVSEGHYKAPLIRFRVQGKLDADRDLIRKYEAKAIISFQKEIEMPEFRGTDIFEHKASVEESGKRILRERLESRGLDPRLFEELFEILAEGDRPKAAEFLEKTGFANMNIRPKKAAGG